MTASPDITSSPSDAPCVCNAFLFLIQDDGTLIHKMFRDESSLNSSPLPCNRCNIKRFYYILSTQWAPMLYTHTLGKYGNSRGFINTIRWHHFFLLLSGKDRNCNMNVWSGKKTMRELMYCQIGIMAPLNVEIKGIRLGISAKAAVVSADRSDIPWISSALKWELFHSLLTLLKLHRMDDEHARAVSHISGTFQSPGSNSSDSTGIIITKPQKCFGQP